MSTLVNYVDSIRDVGATVIGRPASVTGQYYDHIYSQDDYNTGVPTLGVELHSNVPTNAPVPINNLSDVQVLEIVRSNTGVDNYPQVQREIRQGQHTEQANINEFEEDSGGLTYSGISVLIILLVLVALIYLIIRMWQNNQAKKAIMTKTYTPAPSPPPTEIQNSHPPVMATESTDWRKDMELADTKLKELLEQRAITGDSISDKLKNVGAGQFNSTDLAWEAHQSAKKLLTAHDGDASQESIKRTLQLFKQVFAENAVI